MKIWIIGRGYPTTLNGMWGSFELEQAKLLARSGYDVCYIALTLSFLNRKDPRGFRYFKEDGVRIYVYSHFYFPGKMGIYLEKFEDKCWKMLLDKVRNDYGQPELIHVHYPSMLSSIREIDRYRSSGVKLFVTEHWSRVLISNLKRHELKRLQYYANHANCFASVGKHLANGVKELVNVTVPMEVIPNVVSPLFFESSAHISDPIFTFITVGRLVPLKQFDTIIRQFLEEFSGNESVRLKIVGSGTERRRLENLANNHSQIIFTGEINLKDVAKEMAMANALISFSKYETFAVPVIESWACGNPAIVSDRSGIAAYVNESLGIVVSNDSPRQLREAMRIIFENHVKYSKEKISSFAKRYFSDEAIIEKLNMFYSSY